MSTRSWILEGAVVLALTGCLKPTAENLIPATPVETTAGSSGSTSAGASSSSTTGTSATSSGSTGSAASSSTGASTVSGETSGSGPRNLTVTWVNHELDNGVIVDELWTADPPTGVVAFDGGAWGSWLPVMSDAGLTVFRGLPSGRVWLQLTSGRFVETSAEQLDIGIQDYGRPDTEFASTSPDTDIHLEVHGLIPWGTNALLGADNLGMYATNLDTGPNVMTDLGEQFPDGGYSPGPPRGATSVDMFSRYQGQALIDASKGDRAFLLDAKAIDLPAGTAGTVTAELVGGFVEVTPWTAVSGATTVLSATLAPVPQDQTLTVDWRRTQFDAVRTQVNAGATCEQRMLSIQASPHDRSTGLYDGFSLAYLFDALATSTDLDASVSYGNPFPASWPMSIWVDEEFLVNPAGIAGPVQIEADIGAADYLPGTLSQTQALPLSPPQQILVDGQSTSAPISVVDLTPEVSWQSPSLGTAQAYNVTVYDLSYGAPTIVMVTAENSVRIPPGFLQTGGQYVFEVTALNGAGWNFDAAPFQYGLPQAWANAVSDVVSE